MVLMENITEYIIGGNYIRLFGGFIGAVPPIAGWHLDRVNGNNGFPAGGTPNSTEGSGHKTSQVELVTYTVLQVGSIVMRPN